MLCRFSLSRTIVFSALAGAMMLLPVLKSGAQNASGVRLNQIQVIGTHNSYHLKPGPSASEYWSKRNAKLFAGRTYHHPSLTTQLNSGVRQIELDIFADTKGGLFAHPYSELLIAQAGLPQDPPFAPPHVMEKPGFKVMHEQDFDYRSNCQPFTACLREVRAWSKAHPEHVPIFILVETKVAQPNLGIPTVTAEAFTPAVFDDLDHEIRSVFSKADMILPDDVRGDHATLNEAVVAGQWPTLASARGKIIFLMDQKKMGPMYLEGHPSLKGRVLFTNADPGTPDAAFVEQNDSSAATINQIVARGYLVRTRSDVGTHLSESRRDSVLGSGAQMISTDYPSAEPYISGYKVGLPGNAAVRCNPVVSDAQCKDADLAAHEN
ncbi:MAG TPA: phosphatidylinositol-specific phospholipase C1-like protein [Acidobacteriaceae bacterium]|jgi:hypothetical protein